MKSAKEYRAAARTSLSNRWGGAVVMTLLFGAIMGAISNSYREITFPTEATVNIVCIGLLLQLLSIPLQFSFIVAFIDNIRDGKEYKVGQLFTGYNDFTRVFGTLFLKGVYIFLWTLLFIIPGFIKSYSYILTEYILRDYPELKFNGAIERSMAMMKGHKFDLFYLHLTFIGWALLCCLTLGIGFLWLSPYMNAAQAHFYEERKAEFEGQATVQVADAKV